MVVATTVNSHCLPLLKSTACIPKNCSKVLFESKKGLISTHFELCIRMISLSAFEVFREDLSVLITRASAHRHIKLFVPIVLLSRSISNICLNQVLLFII